MFPFLIATMEPVLLGWDELVQGIVVMNVVTAGMLWSCHWVDVPEDRKPVRDTIVVCSYSYV